LISDYVLSIYTIELEYTYQAQDDRVKVNRKCFSF